MLLTGTPVFRARRIEAGLLNAGSDFDDSTTPFDAGLGAFVDLDKPGFIGREALLKAPKDSRTWGMKTVGGVARLGRSIRLGREVVGRVCSSTWSPYLRCGVAIVRLDDASPQPGDSVLVDCIDEQQHDATICRLPMYDENREIPRGLKIDIPQVA